MFGNDFKCKYGDKCKYEHDIEAYMASKPADIEGECPFWKREGGHCRFHLTCRFLGSHRALTADEIKEHKECDDLQTKETNELSMDFRKRLKRFDYNFPKARDFIERQKRATIDADTRARVEAGLIGAIADKERKQVCVLLEWGAVACTCCACFAFVGRGVASVVAPVVAPFVVGVAQSLRWHVCPWVCGSPPAPPSAVWSWLRVHWGQRCLLRAVALWATGSHALQLARPWLLLDPCPSFVSSCVSSCVFS